VELIVETDLESYLPGVLEGELGASFPPAALRAQAVAARTYALHKTTVARSGASFDVADDQSDQVFRGTPATGRGVLFDAVAATRGMVLLHAGQPLPAYFHSTCGGHTSPVEAVFGGSAIPALSGVPCGYCAGARYYRWEVRIPLLDASRSLGLGDAMTGLRIGQRDRGGRARTLVLLSDRETVRRASEVRMALGPARLRSTLIRGIKISGPDLRFMGGGWGHGVGLCQMGARGMAESGAAASDILRHYYPGAQLLRLY
jgi:stage II sporulation protein D